MTAAVHRLGIPSLSVPPSQNTAPVLEFNCLYTHDIRRKQKRWQDGFLRFHTFNKRVMVYDVPRNFIGDMHWNGDGALQEGDEMTLEKDAVLVQVAESVGRTETDLTELKQSAKKSKRSEGGNSSSSPARGVATPSRVMGPPPARPGTASTAGGSTQLKHRSLNALLGTPKGRIGKANIPSKSPFEMRQAEENEEWESGRPPKRSKADPWNVTRTTTTPRPELRKEIPLWKRTSEARAKAAKRDSLPQGQQRLGTKEVIDLSDDGDDSPAGFLPGFSSDAIGPPSSPAMEIVTPAAHARKPPVRSSSPGFQTQNVGVNGTVETPSKSPAVAARKPGAGAWIQTVDETRKKPLDREPSPAPLAPPFLPPSTKPSQTLRMATGAPKRKMLTCLDQEPAPKSASLKEASERAPAIDAADTATRKRKTQRELLEERLAKMNRMAQQRADDLNAVIEDAEATASELQRMDEVSKPKPSRQTEPPQKHPQPAKQDRPFRRVESERGTAASASTSTRRVPGAPARFTPSPTMRTARSAMSPRETAAKPSEVHDELPEPSTGPGASPAPHAEHHETVALPQRQEAVPAQPAPRANTPPKSSPHPPQPEPARRRPGIGRREVRKSAQACFPTALDVKANGTSTVMLSKPFQAPKPPVQPKPPPTTVDNGPWSREAFDLFTWRPPGWNEEEWCVSKGKGDAPS